MVAYSGMSSKLAVPKLFTSVNMILTDIAKYCDENGVLNCVIGGDMNTDMSRTKSGYTVSLRNFIRDGNLNLVLNNVDNSVGICDIYDY